MYIGIDLGTSGVKVVLLGEQGELLSQASASLEVSRPQALWSEQAPQDWWQACQQALDNLSQQHDLATVKAIGLSGQMHGATLLDKNAQVLRPAILWNDGRSARQCTAIEHSVENSRSIVGNLMMPGFTAPKLLWVRQHEPEIFAQIDKVLLPKDYLRYLLSGNFASDMSDAAGTMWLDVAKRDWSDVMLAATGLNRSQMPKLFEGCEITGQLKAELAERWGMGSVPLVAGGGDNAAGAIGVGITKPGQAMLSLGTSGVYFAVSDGYLSNPESALHSFCHALPNTWHNMSVILSAASCLDWVVKLTGQSDVASMLAAVEAAPPVDNKLIFLPYLSGERTPHNNPEASGVFFGLTHSSGPLDLCRAVLEGVAFAFADGLDALHATGLKANDITLIGGGARSPYWRQMLADILGQKLSYRLGGEVGPALGAARLAQLGVSHKADLDVICPVPELVEVHHVDAKRQAYYAQRRETFKALYQQLKPIF
ncbi:xylulokinase [Agarivorans sp. QJM3NY_33]|uniref:xylulokinase n=1 Tax=Agarivorans sp. QJM3NY_33 TaxID=3421432 RepID=UPI003D7DDFCD